MFSHLQLTSSYSLLESPLSVKQAVHQAASAGYRSLALTDHETLVGAIEFYRAAKASGIKPLLGLTVDIEPLVFTGEDHPDQLVVLARNNQGYQDLLRLTTKIKATDSRKLSYATVSQFSSDLIIIYLLTGSSFEYVLSKKDEVIIEQAALTLEQQSDEIFVGLQPKYFPPQWRETFKNHDITTVATPGVRYLSTEDRLAQQVMHVVATGERMGEWTLEELTHEGAAADHSLGTPEHWQAVYQSVGLAEEVVRSNELVESISIKIPLGQTILPKFPETDGLSSADYLKKICRTALTERIPEADDTYKKRLRDELDVIITMGFADYFLIVQDIMRFAHQRGIFTGSGRGSSAGSLVAYVLKITDVDPLEYDLLFERFLNEERYTMPDIDLDFPDNHRHEIFTYLKEKYGPQHVAHISTLGTFAAKSSVRDVGRVFGLSGAELKQWSQAIPSVPGITLKQAYQESGRFRQLVHARPLYLEILKIAQKLEGLPRHVSTHAAGVVLSEEPLTNFVPLIETDADLMLTQYTMDDVEAVGLLKLDILGLKNLTILSDATRFSRFESKTGPVDISDIPMNDPQTLEVFRTGQTQGVFQFESPGIKRVLVKLGPTDFEDIVAVNALYRPGPMEFIDDYIDRKKGRAPVTYPHDDLKPILSVTYGIMVYQEQIMQVAAKLAGYSLNEADMLRRMISQKDHEAMEAGRKHFIQGALKKGYSESVAAEVYRQIERFADYGFNRSHAVAYSKVAYQLAYLKAHYPSSFFAALLRSTSSQAKRKEYVYEATEVGVNFLEPSINDSWANFTVSEAGVRFGFSQIKGVRRDFVQEVLDVRKNGGPFKGLIDFIMRLDEKWRQEELIAALIYAGAFDQLNDNRGQLIASLPKLLADVTLSKGHAELLDIFQPKLVDAKDFTTEEKLQQEYEQTGFYFSENPESRFKKLAKSLKVTPVIGLVDGQAATILVRVLSVRTIQTKKGEPMSFVEATDATDPLTLILFPKTHRQYIRDLKVEHNYVVSGEAERRDGKMQLLVNRVQDASLLEEKRQEGQTALYLRVQDTPESSLIDEIQTVLKGSPGSMRVFLYDASVGQIHRFKKENYVTYSKELHEALVQLLGAENVRRSTAE